MKAANSDQRAQQAQDNASNQLGKVELVGRSVFAITTCTPVVTKDLFLRARQ